MISIKNVLLASHGTKGAQAAASYAQTLCQTTGAALHQLVVVPEFWKGMMGDDWLNNGISRDRYARYLESEIGREIDLHIKQVSEQAESNKISFSHEIQVGEPHQCLVSVCSQNTFDLVIMGSTRPKSEPGLNSKMALNKISGKINTPLLIVPFPQQ